MKKLIAWMLAAVVLGLAGCSGGPKLIEEATTVEGRALEVRVYNAEDAEQAKDLLAAMPEQARTEWNTLTPTGDSDFAGINELAGSRNGTMEQPSYDLLMRCFGYKKDTEEAFDFLIGPLRRAWGLWDNNPRVPDQAEIDSALVLIREGGTFVVDKGVLLSREHMAIDLDGVAEGVVVDRLVSRLRHKSLKDFTLRFGKVIRLGDEGPAEGYFEVPLADPADQNQPLGLFTLRNQSLAVADVGDGAFAYEGSTWHTHLDPRSGRPADQVLAVAVVCREAERADALSEGLFILGADKGLELASGMDDVEALFVTAGEAGSQVRMTPGMEAWYHAAQ